MKGVYSNDSVKAGTEGIEIKTTRKAGGAVDTRGARNQWLAVFVYNIDNTTQPARERKAMTFTEIYLGQVTIEDFRRNPRGELGTRTATLHREGILKLRPKLDLQRSDYTFSPLSFGSASRAMSK